MRELPFPLVKHPRFNDCYEYDIPDDKKAEVLKSIYFSAPDSCPKMTDLWRGRSSKISFQVKDLRVIVEGGMTLVVSPYYFKTGDTVFECYPLKEHHS